MPESVTSRKILLDEMKSLVDELNLYRNSYYNNNESLVSDKDYDEKFDRLAELEKQTGVVMSNSPTCNVGYTPVSSLKKVKHSHPLLSLDKIYDDVQGFYKYFEGKDVVMSAKMDGLTASLTYEDGKLIRAESRGDGEIGEDITHSAKVFCNLPLCIPIKGTVVIDGECVITKEQFKIINKQEKTEYKNPRNLASGTVRQLDPQVTKSRKVRFVAWNLESGEETNSIYTRLWCLRDMGFEVAPFDLLHGSYDSEDVDYTIQYLKRQSEKNSYPIDGIVGRFDSKEYGDSLGLTAHHPKHSLAFKFYQEKNETTLIDIEWQPSRTGLINPVAIFEPVEIDGTTVSRASLCNVSVINELKLGLGDHINVIKANQIIPQVVENLDCSGTYTIPDRCPVCGAETEIESINGRKMLYCTGGTDCEGVAEDRFVNFVSRQGMNIDGMSIETIRCLRKLGILPEFASIYHLKEFKSSLIKIEGMGEQSVNKLLDAIERSRTCKLESVLVALGIPGIGISTAKTITQHVNKTSCPFLCNNLLEKFQKMCEDDYDWSQLDGFGIITSNTINGHVKTFIDEITGLLACLTIESNTGITNTLEGKTFCITGKLTIYGSRNDLVKAIEDNGGKVVSSISSSTNYLITNDANSGSAKNEAAKKCGTKIISEEQFLSMISGVVGVDIAQGHDFTSEVTVPVHKESNKVHKMKKLF